MKHGMSCKQPATRWEDALPVGNGSIGAIVYGNICHETIIVNHEELWVYRDKPEPPDISGSVPELRELLARGEWSMLDRFLDMMLQEKGYDAEQKDNYHPALAIKLDVEPAAPFRDYTRELDFDTAEARVTWKESSNTHSRGCFVSRDTDVVCVTMENDANDVTYAVRLVQVDLVEENSHAKGKRIEWRDIPITFQSSLEPGWLAITGTYANGTQFGGVARVIAPGGKTCRPVFLRNGYMLLHSMRRMNWAWHHAFHLFCTKNGLISAIISRASILMVIGTRLIIGKTLVGHLYLLTCIFLFSRRKAITSRCISCFIRGTSMIFPCSRIITRMMSKGCAFLAVRATTPVTTVSISSSASFIPRSGGTRMFPCHRHVVASFILPRLPPGKTARIPS